MGNTIGDLAFPDNPKRRGRAEGLREDILQYIQQFQTARDDKKAVFGELKTQLDDVLKKLGVSTRDELDKYIRDNLENDSEIKAYDEMRASIDKQDDISNLIVDIAGLFSVGVFAVGSVFVLVGVIAFTTVIGAVEVTGGLAIAAALALALMGVYEGYLERAKLREAIHMMLGKRAEGLQIVLRMGYLNDWAQDIVDKLKAGKTFEEMKGKLMEALKEPWDKCTLDYCKDKLHDQDVKNGAWMNEDNGYGYLYSAQNAADEGTEGEVCEGALGGFNKQPSAEVTYKSLATGDTDTLTLTFGSHVSNSVAIASFGEDTWFIKGKAVSTMEDLEKEEYTMERVPGGKTGKSDVFYACRLTVRNITFV
ncbi:hypothetical protein PT974_02952 [Cladobotryum mycophilum]|uniref:Uncharacterized protein n=1 Tax=Cladobotryum mycophilum TaxID=491253 RepID=A0ABR0SZH1_9HYPO